MQSDIYHRFGRLIKEREIARAAPSTQELEQFKYCVPLYACNLKLQNRLRLRVPAKYVTSIPYKSAERGSVLTLTSVPDHTGPPATVNLTVNIYQFTLFKSKTLLPYLKRC